MDHQPISAGYFVSLVGPLAIGAIRNGLELAITPSRYP
jgi:hypothetical protein